MRFVRGGVVFGQLGPSNVVERLSHNRSSNTLKGRRDMYSLLRDHSNEESENWGFTSLEWRPVANPLIPLTSSSFLQHAR
jgi:hypothetical protein